MFKITPQNYFEDITEERLYCYGFVKFFYCIANTGFVLQKKKYFQFISDNLYLKTVNG